MTINVEKLNILTQPLKLYLEERGASVRLRDGLINGHVDYLAQVLALRQKDLKRIPNIWEKSLKDLESILAKDGFQIGQLHDYAEVLGYRKNRYDKKIYDYSTSLMDEELLEQIEFVTEDIRRKHNIVLGAQQVEDLKSTLVDQLLKNESFLELVGVCSADFVKATLKNHPEILDTAVEEIVRVTLSRAQKFDTI